MSVRVSVISANSTCFAVTTTVLNGLLQILLHGVGDDGCRVLKPLVLQLVNVARLAVVDVEPEVALLCWVR
jgi:hypothetical protein